MENNLSNPPFYIGQEVVALNTIPHKESGGIKKDKIYTVLFLCECKGCGNWQVGFKYHDHLGSGWDCPLCNQSHLGTRFWLVQAKHFAPVSRLRISNELTIAEDLFQTKPVEERADVLIPETIEK